jgi:Putative transposase
MSKFQIELLSKNGASVIGVANDAESALNVMDEAMRQYLSRYTHRVAISNRRLIAADAKA